MKKKRRGVRNVRKDKKKEKKKKKKKKKKRENRRGERKKEWSFSFHFCSNSITLTMQWNTAHALLDENFHSQNQEVFNLNLSTFMISFYVYYIYTLDIIYVGIWK
jgi:hypothetical protein